MAGAAVSRLAGFDRLRTVLTVLVIAHHTAITYGGSGGWFYREVRDGGAPLSLAFTLFCSINQAFFMGLFFLLAGYFSPPAPTALVRVVAPAQQPVPGDAAWLLSALAVGAAALAIRQWVPVGDNRVGLQLGYFASYVFLFALGIAAWPQRWLERIPPALARRWSRIALWTVPLLPLTAAATGALAGRAVDFSGGLGMGLVGSDEDVQQLGGTDAVDQLDAGGLAPQHAGGRWQGLAGRHALAQRAALGHAQPPGARSLGHRPVRRGRGEQDRGAEARDRLQQIRRAGLGQQHRGRAHAQRKQQQPAQAEGEGQRRAADEQVVGPRPQHMRRKAGAGRHHVAVEVHRRLGLAGGAAGEGQQRHVVGGGVDGGELRGLARGAGLQTTFGGHAEVQHLAQHRVGGGGLRQLVGQHGVAQGMRHLRLGDDLAQLLGPQHRHRAHRDAARLHHCKPAGRQHRAVGRTQQHAVARHQAQVVDQHMGDAAGLGLQLGIGPHQAIRADDAAPPAPAAGHRVVQQPGTAVQPRRKLQLGQGEQELGLVGRRRQPVAGEAVDMGAGLHRRLLSPG